MKMEKNSSPSEIALLVERGANQHAKSSSTRITNKSLFLKVAGLAAVCFTGGFALNYNQGVATDVPKVDGMCNKDRDCENAGWWRRKMGMCGASGSVVGASCTVVGKVADVVGKVADNLKDRYESFKGLLAALFKNKPCNIKLKDFLAESSFVSARHDDLKKLGKTFNVDSGFGQAVCKGIWQTLFPFEDGAVMMRKFAQFTATQCPNMFDETSNTKKNPVMTLSVSVGGGGQALMRTKGRSWQVGICTDLLGNKICFKADCYSEGFGLPDVSLGVDVGVTVGVYRNVKSIPGTANSAAGSVGFELPFTDVGGSTGIGYDFGVNKKGDPIDLNEPDAFFGLSVSAGLGGGVALSPLPFSLKMERSQCTTEEKNCIDINGNTCSSDAVVTHEPGSSTPPGSFIDFVRHFLGLDFFEKLTSKNE